MGHPCYIRASFLPNFSFLCPSGLVVRHGTDRQRDRQRPSMHALSMRAGHNKQAGMQFQTSKRRAYCVRITIDRHVIYLRTIDYAGSRETICFSQTSVVKERRDRGFSPLLWFRPILLHIELPAQQGVSLAEPPCCQLPL